MLTRDDLNAIQIIVKKEVSDALFPVNNRLELLQKDIREVKKDVRKLRKDLNVTISTFDNDIIDARHRVDRIENHLNLPPLKAN